MKITRSVIAEGLNGREIGDELSEEIRAKMEGTDLVVVFGASDDLTVFYGAINDELGIGKIYLTTKGLLENSCEEDECPYFKKIQDKARVLEALWCAEPDICFTYKTDIGHKTFDILEDGEKCCRGIVFHLSDAVC